MIAVIQRVKRATLSIDGSVYSQIGHGLTVLLGVHENDTERDADVLAAKCSGLRIFNDEAGKMNRSLPDVQGEWMVVSNFTLCADCTHGRRPSFTAAMEPQRADALYRRFAEKLAKTAPVKTGVFGANMQIDLTNDGPVTLVVRSEDLIK